MSWDWDFAISILPRLLSGAVVTVQATLLGSTLAMVLGLAIAILRRTAHRPLRWTIHSIVEFIRRTPLLVQLYFLFYVLPDAGILLSPLTAGVLGIGIHYASYTAEVYRAGIEGVHRGQWDAARACNLRASQTWLHVVLPQAVPPMVPALANYLIVMFKETPLLAAIAVAELMNQGLSVANFHYRYLEPLTMVGLFFVIITVPAMLGARWLEHKVRQTR
ncbi:MAG: ectoine/hydroxyectoine ABC transporter permease subunit EhuD [Rhodospirillaceae bacterium]|nr:ectoine/hydroxyectoine ABC transporter permease subunit EhuD [Rhodospirillaceae bacterium]